ncbi:MAG: response regulator transcription factor [Spirochaetales bacterium]|nr:response regulator transcription factor [Spirochaetales bacterium]
MTIRLLLADDQTLFVENLKKVLEAADGRLSVVGIAEDGLEAVRMARELAPDVILMDVRMPKLDGVGATIQIRTHLPRIAIVMLTVFDDDDYVFEALDHGASGYLLKNMKPEMLISSIHAVYEGAVLISPSVAQKLVHGGSGQRPKKHATEPWVTSLSPREMHVLCLLLEHLSNREIAERLCISDATVRNYVSTIYDKMGATDRFHAMRLADANRAFLQCP